ncbi:cell filamentation protein Fic [Treponema sp. R80B11-R83G3]
MPPNPLQIRNSTAEFLIFTKQAGESGISNESLIEVRVQDGTIWLSQKLMAALFDCSIDNISLHLKNIFAEGEMDEFSVTEDFSVTASDGKNYHTKHYNLDAIIAVGYRYTQPSPKGEGSPLD